jgi:branched-chain amino acid transport system ATP-binding protein
VLEVSGLSIRFGGLQALQDLDLVVNEYEIVGLIGPNGAGKTTAFNCITGFYTPTSGTVRYRDEDVTRLPPYKKAALGFGRTFQNVGMVKSSTVLENMKTAQHAAVGYSVLSGLAGSGAASREERKLDDRSMAILDMLGLADLRDTRVGGLSYGTLKLLELGCALATDPDILLLDEPTSGMGPEESNQLGERLLELRREFGLTMLVIEHHVPLVLRVCDHVYVLNFGRLLAEGKPSEIQSHPEVVAAYLGGEAPDALAATHETDEDAALDAELGAARAGHAAPRQRAAAPRTTARKAAPRKKAAAKKATTRKAAAKKAPAKKATDTKAPTKRAAKKAAPRKRASATDRGEGSA